jgi:LmbE family N-acetylglucosaminyl deacetylase
MFVEPAERFPGTIMIIAPHMDDEVLACGGTIAMLPQPERIHVVYATDGMKSPSPIVPGVDSITPDLGELRMKESKAAIKQLGVPEENAHFLCLPEAELKKHVPALRNSLQELIDRVQPAHILMPFRYDRHLDHLAINHVITALHRQGRCRAALTEYFVYYRWRLLPARDVRRYIQPQHLFKVDTKRVANQKRLALDCFKSQTTIFYPWQTRPILTSILLDEESYNPELFLQYDPAAPGAAVFARAILWIRVVHRLEPFLQRWKYRLGALWRRGVQQRDRQAA